MEKEEKEGKDHNGVRIKTTELVNGDMESEEQSEDHSPPHMDRTSTESHAEDEDSGTKTESEQRSEDESSDRKVHTLLLAVCIFFLLFPFMVPYTHVLCIFIPRVTYFQFDRAAF